MIPSIVADDKPSRIITFVAIIVGNYSQQAAVRVAQAHRKWSNTPLNGYAFLCWLTMYFTYLYLYVFDFNLCKVVIKLMDG